MICIITGDIINSRNLENPAIWMDGLKAFFETLGSGPEVWDIYRGDSFQLEVTNPEEAFFVAIRIKAIIRSIKGIDVRLALGIGEKSYHASRITESNGEAFIYSGELVEKIKSEKQTLAVRSPWPEWDSEMNVCFRLALIAIDNWKPKTAKLVRVALTYPEKGQQEIADLLGIQQAAVSQGLKRAHLGELMELENIYRKRIKTLNQNNDHTH